MDVRVEKIQTFECCQWKCSNRIELDCGPPPQRGRYEPFFFLCIVHGVPPQTFTLNDALQQWHLVVVASLQPKNINSKHVNYLETKGKRRKKSPGCSMTPVFVQPMWLVHVSQRWHIVVVAGIQPKILHFNWLKKGRKKEHGRTMTSVIVRPQCGSFTDGIFSS
jgi:hypothetical protein